MEFNRLRLIS